MNDHERRWLIDSLSLPLQNDIPSIIYKTSPVLEFEQTQELNNICGETSESFDIPAYLWAMHNMLESSKETLKVPSEWSEEPRFSDSYEKMIRKFLSQAVSKSQVNRLAHWILGAWQKEVGAEKYADKTQQTETRQDSLGADSTPTEIISDPDTQTAMESESKDGRALKNVPSGHLRNSKRESLQDCSSPFHHRQLKKIRSKINNSRRPRSPLPQKINHIVLTQKSARICVQSL
jgi:hypothetical protein